MALLGSAISGEVGLRLLFSPICSNIVIRTACCTVGTVLPVYYTFDSIERNDQHARDKWLVYWAAYGSFSLVEMFSDKLISWVPFYYHMKFAFLVWLQLPTHNGSNHLYKRHIRPFLLKHQARFDLMLSCASHEIGKFVVAHQSEIEAVKFLIRKGATTANQMLGDIGLLRYDVEEEEEEENPNGPSRFPSQHADSNEDTSS